MKIAQNADERALILRLEFPEKSNDLRFMRQSGDCSFGQPTSLFGECKEIAPAVCRILSPSNQSVALKPRDALGHNRVGYVERRCKIRRAHPCALVHAKRSEQIQVGETVATLSRQSVKIDCNKMPDSEEVPQDTEVILINAW